MANFSSESLDFFCLNVRGLSNPDRLTEVCNITKYQSKSNKIIIALQETKLMKMKEEHNRIIKEFGFSHEMVPANDKAGGLMILYPKHYKMTPMMKNENLLAIVLNLNGCENAIIANVYINPKDHKIDKFRKSFEELDHTKTIIAMGDFNAIDHENIVENQKPPKTNDIRVLRYNKITQIFGSQKMYDLGKALSRTQPTHYDKRTRASNRIDYFFGNLPSENLEISLYTTSFSDHKCMHLMYYVNKTLIGKGIWRLNDEILEDKTMITQLLHQTVEPNHWNAKNYDIFKSRIRDSLRLICIRNVKKKKMLEKQLMREFENSERHLQTKMEVHPKDLKDHEEKILKLKSFQQKEAALIAKSIKNFYLDVSEGDPKTTKLMVSCMQSKQEIRKIITKSGEAVTDEDEIVDKFADFFEECYQKNQTPNEKISQLYLNNFFQKNEKKLQKFELSESFKNNDDNPISEFEVEKAIMKLNSRSAPGSDGLTSDLYKTQKEFFVPLLTKLFNDIYETSYVPPSFEQAIIKVIPKKPNVYDIGNFRAISLINTDQKILSHIIAFRLKKVFDILIGAHQTAHLTNRNINTSLMKLQTFASEMSKREGIVALDFNKAFDKVDRKYMMHLIHRLPIDSQTKNIIEKMYENTSAIVNVGGVFSTPFKTETGVRQGCPTSALVFNLAIEPLLQRIQRSKLIKSSQKTKSVAFADDISICMNLHSIRNLMTSLNNFAKISGLTVNINKSKVLTQGKTYQQEKWELEKVSKAKILGITVNIGGKIDIETKNDLTNTARKASLYVGPTVSLHARAKNIETFIFPKLIYILRHYTGIKTLLRKLNGQMINQLWLEKKHNVNQEIVNTPIKNGGIGLKNLEKCILTAKIMNLKLLAFNPMEKHFLTRFKESKAFSLLEKDLKDSGIELLDFSEQKLKIQYFFQNIEITSMTTSRELYEFLIKSLITIPCFKHINMSAMKLQISPNIIFDFITRLWKNRRLKSFDKNIL